MRPGWLRPLLHASSALILLTLLHSWQLLRIVSMVGLFTAMLLETLRLTRPRFRDFLARVVPVFRPDEASRPTGAAWLSAAYALAVWLPPRAGIAGVLVGALADPAASLIGSRWGRGRRKSWPGTLGALGTAVFALWLLGVPPVAVAAASAVATGLERWPGPFDDNLLVGPAAGVMVWWLG